MDFNRNWLFKRENEHSFSKINLPHDAMLDERRSASCRNGVNSGYFHGGKYVYEKTFILTAGEAEKCVSLNFDGVYQNCVVYINGEKACEHKYGYTPFEAELTGKVKAGENIITVTVDNSLEPNCRWYSGSGIYRPVELLIRSKNHIEYAHVKTVSVFPAEIEVDAAETLGGEIRVEVYDGAELVASGVSGIIEVPNAKLWTAETPNLYKIKVIGAEDSRELLYGIRELLWSPEKGLTVNGERVLLRGGCIHHDNGVLGACEFRAAEERRIRLLKENGFNCIRMAHHPASQILLDVCDRLGMYVMNETFDGWYIPKTYHDYARWFDTEWENDITAMVESSRNHCSVIMYSVGNEVTETESERGGEVCKALVDKVHELDNSRPVTAGINVMLNVMARCKIGLYKEKGEYKAEPLPEEKGYKERKSGSAFFNELTSKLGKGFFVFSEGNMGHDVCKGGAALDFLGLNYAGSQYDWQAKHFPNRMMVGSETMAADLPYNWERVKKYPQLAGDFVWSAWDYLGEAGIGDWTYHSYKGLPLLAGQGMIDITGKPLAAMAFMQTVWELREKPYICVRPLNHAHEIPDTGSWQFTNAIDSWSWQGYEGEKAVVEVYSAGAAIRILLNGKVYAEKPLKEFKTLFKIPYVKGTLTAQALDKTGRIISENSLVSAEEETLLTIKAENPVINANGNDLCFISIEFTDNKGCLKPYVEQRVEIEVKGAAALAGFGSALCKTDEVYNKTYHNSYRGRCQAVLRSGTVPGKAEITVRSVGYRPVTITVDII